jgi:UDP-N-acetylglucosamine acyltransferase
MTSARIDPTARVSPSADLADDVTVEAYAVIGEGVVVGPGCSVGAHSVLKGPARIGKGCRIFPFSSIGSDPQDLKFKGEATRLEIGSDNTFREFVTVNRGTVQGGWVTSIGSSNLFMAYTHIAHDCVVGSHTVFANAATLGGHVTVEDHAVVGAFSGVHQYCRIGRYAFIGGYSVVTQDALPFVKTVGNRAKTYGINTIGLERKGFAPEAIRALKSSYRILVNSKLNTSQAMERIEAELAHHEDCRYLISFIRSSERGIVK